MTNASLNLTTAVIAPPRPRALRNETEINKLSKRLYRLVGQAIADFRMIEDGDKLMVCVSGGKDSYSMLDILLGLQARAPVGFELIAVNIDQGHPGFPQDTLPNYLKEQGVAFHIENQDTYSIVKRVIPEGDTMCSLCSRLRRGIIYRLADELGCSKIALGHHRDDMLETLFLNMFYGGKMKSMPPKLLSDDKQNIVIRPLAYCKEKDIERYALLAEMPIIPCNLCGSQDNLQRQVIKEMLQGWEKQHPGRLDSIFRGISDIVPSHMLDPRLFDFKSLQQQPADPVQYVNVMNL